MEDKKINEQELFDPVGIELLLSIISTSASIVSFLHEFGFLAKKDTKILDAFETINYEVLSLQNSLDYLILTLERYSLQSKDSNIHEKSNTISDTLIFLKEKDFIRWIDIQESIKRIDHRVFSLISEIRLLNLKLAKKYPFEAFDNKLIRNFDDLILNLGKLSFGELIERLRDLLFQVTDNINRLIACEKKNQC